MALRPDVVGVFNTSEDTTDLLRTVIEQAGFVVVTAFTNRLRDGKLDLEAFMRQHRPKVIVYDIAIPYESNWRLFQHISSSPACEGVYFVLTTTNAEQVRKVAGADIHFHELVGKPLDLEEVVRSVKESARRRPTA
jgi:DNA-binding response OmpR family regulator